MEEKDFYLIDEVSEKLGISIKSVRRMVASGELKSVKIRNLYRIPKEAYDAFLKRKRKPRICVNADDSVDLFGNVNKKDDLNWADISAFWQNPSRSQMTFVDLFCGAGGLSKGLELSGLEGICGLDWFKEACMTYNRNFGHPFVNGDINDSEIKQKFYDTVKERLDGRRLSIVAGGFPCQGFSMAGNRIVDDPRNSLYLELIEIVKHLNPEFVICENVKGLRSMLEGKVEQKILEDFRAIGYEMNVTTLCAADYYTPQKRERVIFIGNRIGKLNFHPKPILAPSEYITTGRSIADLMEHPEDKAFNHVPTRHRPDMMRRMLELPEGQSLYKGYSDAWKKCPWDEASCTIKENHGGVNIHPKLPRVLTAREMARLQSFPDDFIFEGPKNKQLVQIGNAVPPLLNRQNYQRSDIGKYKAEALADRLLKINPDADIKLHCEYISEDNISRLVHNCDIAVNALDFRNDIPLKFDEICRAMRVPILHPYNFGWGGLLMIVTSDSLPLSSIMRNSNPVGFELEMAKYVSGYSQFWNLPENSWLHPIVEEYTNDNDNMVVPQLSIGSWIVGAMSVDAMFRLITNKPVKQCPKFYLTSMRESIIQ